MAKTLGAQNGVTLTVYNAHGASAPYTTLIPAGVAVRWKAADVSVPPAAAATQRVVKVGEEFIAAVELADAATDVEEVVGITQAAIEGEETGTVIMTGIVQCTTDGTVTVGTGVTVGAGGEIVDGGAGPFLGVALETDRADPTVIDTDLGGAARTIAMCFIGTSPSGGGT